MRKFVQIIETNAESLIAAARKSANSTVGSVVDGAVVFLNVGHKEIEKILAKHIKLHSGCISLTCNTVGVAVGKNDNHLFGLALSDEVVENKVHFAYFEIYLLGVGGAADEVHYGVTCALAVVVCGGNVNNGVAECVSRIRPISYVLYATVRNVFEGVRQVKVATHIQKAVFETLVGKPFGVNGVHNLHSVNDKAVRIDVGSGRSESDRPHALVVFFHFVTTGKLNVYLNLLSGFV